MYKMTHLFNWKVPGSQSFLDLLFRSHLLRKLHWWWAEAIEYTFERELFHILLCFKTLSLLITISKTITTGSKLLLFVFTKFYFVFLQYFNYYFFTIAIRRRKFYDSYGLFVTSCSCFTFVLILQIYYFCLIPHTAITKLRLRRWEDTDFVLKFTLNLILSLYYVHKVLVRSLESELFIFAKIVSCSLLNVVYHLSTVAWLTTL